MIKDERSDSVYVTSTHGDKTQIPLSSWQYFDGEEWMDDLILTMSGTTCKHMLGIMYTIISAYTYITIQYNTIQ